MNHPSRSHPAWNKGIDHLSLEAKKCIGEATKKRCSLGLHPKGMLGKRHSIETINKIKSWRPSVEQNKNKSHPKDTHPKWLGEDIIYTCPTCDKKINIRPNAKVKFCSRRCIRKLNPNKGTIRIPYPKCYHCDVNCKVRSAKTCNKCKAINRTGEKSNFWKGGITPISKKLRVCQKYKQWRLSVYERDNFTCQLCKKRGVLFQADHFPVTFSELLKTNNIDSLKRGLECNKLWDISNGRTLCIPCHKSTSTYLKRS